MTALHVPLPVSKATKASSAQPYVILYYKNSHQASIRQGVASGGKQIGSVGGKRLDRNRSAIAQCCQSHHQAPCGQDYYRVPVQGRHGRAAERHPRPAFGLRCELLRKGVLSS